MAIYQRMTIRGRGGALPTYQSQQAPYVPGQGINARVSGADAEILARGYNMEAKAMEGLAKAGKNAVDVGLQAADDYAKTKAVELATKYKMGMRQSMYGEGGILTREGENAFTANADTMKRSKELRAELLKDLDGSLVAQKFNAAIDPEEAEYSLKAQEYEGKQYRVFQDRTDKAAFSEAAEMAIAGYADPKSFAKGTGEALWFQEQILRRQGYSGEALERGLKESSSKIFAGGIEQALAADDLASARRLLAEGSRGWKPALPHDLSKVGGVVEKGNIDIDNRKVEHRPDGSIATVESFSFNFDGVEVLIPTVIDGKKVSNDEAIAHFMKTGEHLGKFKTPEAATEYAIKLHENHAIQYGEARTRMTSDDVAKAKKAIKVKAEALEKKWEAAQKEAEAAKFEQDVATQSAEVLKQVNEFPDPEVRTAKAVELTRDIEDPKLKAAVRKAVDGTLKEQELQGKARLVLELDALDSMLDQVGPDGTTYTPTARLAVIQSANVSEEAKRVVTKGVYDMLDGKNNEAASASGLAAWRAWFDSTGGRASQEEMQAKMLDFGLNAADRKKAADYKGVRLEYPQQRVFSLIDSVFGKGKKGDAEKARMYEAIVTQAKASGKTMSDKELKALIYQQDAEGSIAGGERTWYGGVDTMTYTEAMEKTGGRVGLFRPEVPEDTAKQMRAILEYTQPWSIYLDKAGRDLLVQTTYLQQQMGIQLELTAEERQKFQNAINKYNAGNR